jgi:hypothetical protein
VLDRDDGESMLVTRRIGIPEKSWSTTRIGEYRFTLRGLYTGHVH